MNQELRNRAAETVIISIMLLSAWFVLVEPTRTRAREARAIVATLQAEALQFESSTMLPPDQAQAHQQRVDALFDLARLRPPLEQHEQILALCHAFDLEVGRINPTHAGKPAHIGPIITNEQRITIQARGTFSNIAAFLSELATEAPMVAVESFSIGPSHDSYSSHVALSASLRISGIEADHSAITGVAP